MLDLRKIKNYCSAISTVIAFVLLLSKNDGDSTKN